ncbi:MAG: hypothetical protein CMO34_01975 [Verrucomicrobia bacterium]|nr:hypothetical protein [Verrucomicrobiota bacterium]|tara:strand:- start:115 stop:513 length:399 start_codon:yes stop_codon:yes gene_type:complete
MERNVNQYFFLFILLNFIFSCSNAQTKDPSIQLLSAIEFKSKLSATDKAQLIDVRTANEFKGGSIDGAINYNILDGTFSSKLSSLDKNKTVFVFCAKGGRSNKASKILMDAGFKEVIDLKGGYDAWKENLAK